MSQREDGDEALRLLDELKKRSLLAASVRVGEVEIRVGELLRSPSEQSAEDEEQETAKRLEEERMMAQYAASLGGFPGYES